MTTESSQSRADQGSGGLRAKLLRSHLTLASIGILSLLVSLLLTAHLGNITQKLTLHRAPAVEASMKASAGLNSSLAALRGWILIGAPSFSEQRDVAWKNEIEPAMSELTRIVKSNPEDSEITKEELEKLRKLLSDLRESQWWIEDVARAPGNRPGSVIVQHELRPQGNRIFDSITAMIEIERENSAGESRQQLLAQFADARGYFTQTNNHVERFVDTAEAADIDHFRRSLAIVDARLKQIELRSEMLTDEQREQFDLIRLQLPAYKLSAEQAIEVRQSDQWNLALAWLRSDALPRVRLIDQALKELSQAEEKQMKADSETVRRYGQTATFVTAALIALMAMVAGFLSIRSAGRITKPIEQLVHATKRLADGSLTDDIFVSGSDELARLTASFNSMRSSLAEGRASLEDRERRMRTILESTPNGIVVVDDNGLIKLANSETELLFGYSRVELVDQPIEILVPDSVRDQHPQLRNAFFAKPVARRMGTGRNLTGRRKDGSEFAVEIGLNPMTTEEGQFVLAAIVDVSEIRKRERELDQERHLVHTLMTNAPDLIYFKDVAGKFLKVSAELARRLGLSDPSQATGRTNADFFDSEFAAAAQTMEEEIMRTGRAIVGSQEHIRWPDGTALWISTTRTVLRDPDDQVIGTIGISHDINAMMAAEEAQAKALAAAEAANRAKSDFLANMSHEIRTPLNAVIGMTELLLDGSLQSEQREYMKMVRDSGESLLSIVNDILDYSKIEAGKLLIDKHPFDIHESIGNAMKSLGERAHRKNLELAFHVGVDVPRNVYGDIGRIRQVIINLVGNAIKFTQEGEVCLDVSLIGADQDSVRIMFEVRDTGIGISSEKLEHIFGAFEQADSSTTREYGGTGLGLSISERLVQLMGGELTVQSEEGKGSQFRFTLHFDVADVTADQKKSAPAPVVEKLHGTRVLIVDDNRTNRHILDEMVRSWGMRPTLAEDVDQAIQELSSSAEPKFPLVLSDVHMPRKDGFTLVRLVHNTARWKDTAFIMLSSGDRPGDVDLCRKFGLSSYLIKPVKQSELYKAITQSLGVAWAEDALETRSFDVHMRPLNVLLAEDSLPNQKLAMGVLKKLGHQVTVAVDGREAVEKVDSSERFDLILMDVQMPVMDGFEATAAIRILQAESGHACPIVAMTAHAMQGDRERCLDAGMDDYVAKPVRIKDLREAMVRVIPDLESQPASTPMDDLSETPSLPDTAFDWSIGLENCYGDEDLLHEIVQAFQEECPLIVANLKAAVQNSDAQQVESAAHKLKGALHSIGAVEAGEKAEQIEAIGRQGNVHAAPDVLHELNVSLKQLQRQIEKFSR